MISLKLRTCVLLCAAILASAATLSAQDKGHPPPQPAPEKVEKNEPAKYERDNSSMLLHYILAAIAVILIMVLICMPVRRD